MDIFENTNTAESGGGAHKFPPLRGRVWAMRASSFYVGGCGCFLHVLFSSFFVRVWAVVRVCHLGKETTWHDSNTLERVPIQQFRRYRVPKKCEPSHHSIDYNIAWATTVDPKALLTPDVRTTYQWLTGSRIGSET